MVKNKFSLRDRLESFKYAIHGFNHIIREEHNFRIHLTLGLLTIILGYYFGLSRYEWILTLASIGSVLILEVINTSIERICNLISSEHNPEIKIIKDLASFAVLLASMTALLIGLIIFIPKIISYA